MKKFILAICFYLGMGSSVMGMIQEPNRALPAHWIQSSNNSEDPSREIPLPSFMQHIPQSNNNSQEPGSDRPKKTKHEKTNSCDFEFNSYRTLPRSGSFAKFLYEESLSSHSYEAPIVQSYPVDEGPQGSFRIIQHFRRPPRGYPDYQPPIVNPSPEPSGNPPPPDPSASQVPPPTNPLPPTAPPSSPNPPPPDQSSRDNQWSIWFSEVAQVPHRKKVLWVGAFFACYGAVRCFNDRKKYWSAMAPLLKKYLPRLFAKKKKRKSRKMKRSTA